MAISLGLLVCTLTCKKEMFEKKKREREGERGRERGRERERERESKGEREREEEREGERGREREMEREGERERMGGYLHWSYFWCDEDVLHSECEAVQLKECGEEPAEGTQQQV